MTEATFLSQPYDTFSNQITNRIAAKAVRNTIIRESTTSIQIQSRTVPSSKIEGRASLRYSPREPVIINTSTKN